MLLLHERPRRHRRYEVKGLAYSPCGRYLLAGVERRMRDLGWDRERDGRLLRFDLHQPTADPLEYEAGGFVDVGWSPHGDAVAAVTGARVHVLSTDLETARHVDLMHAESVVMPVDATRPGNFWVVRSRFGEGGLYEFPLRIGTHDFALSMLDVRRDHAFVMQSLALRPDGETAAVGGMNAVQHVDLGSWIARARGFQNGWVRHLAFSPSGATLAAASGRSVVLWDVDEDPMRRIAALRGHTREVTDIAFTPDGRWLLSASLDGTVRLWHPHGTEARCYDWDVGAVRSIACAPDGMTAAVGGSGRKSILVFDLD